MLEAAVLHADETPVAMVDPGAGKTKRAYVWGYARGAFDAQPGVIYDFCVGRGAQFPLAFLGASHESERSWRGTLVRDEYKAYERVIVQQPGRIAAGCLAHARRKFDELLLDGGKSAVAIEALQRIAEIFVLERALSELSSDQRLAQRRSAAQPLWDQLHAWLRLERSRVPEGSATTKASPVTLLALLDDKWLSFQLPAEALPTVVAPDDVQAVLVQLDPLDQQSHDAVLLDGEQVFPDLAHLAHGNQDRGFVQFLLFPQRHAGLPDANNHLGLLQRLMDLREHRSLDFQCGQRPDVAATRVVRGPGMIEGRATCRCT